jgi:hypothetical protein
MVDRASGPASFSGHDRRRLAMTLKQTSEARVFQRVQAVLRVAEGDTIRCVAHSLRISRRSVQRWVEIYRAPPSAGGLARRPTLRTTPRGDRSR